MVVIRLSRGGAKKLPFYHLIVTDHRKRRDCGDATRIGYFNPVAKGAEKRLEINMEEVEKWLKVGAQMSPRVQSLVKEYKKAAQ